MAASTFLPSSSRMSPNTTRAPSRAKVSPSAEPSPRRAARLARSMRMNRSRGFIRSERRRPMPEKATMERVREDKREGKAPSTQAGEFVREEMDHIREGKHGARSTKQAIAIGLSKARRAGVKLPPPSGASASEETRTQAKSDYVKGQTSPGRAASSRRCREVKA